MTFIEGRLEPRYMTIPKKCIECLRGDFNEDAFSKHIVKGKLIYHIEKRVDVSIAVDMLRLAYKDAYDICILVSNDGDFVPAVNEIKDMGKYVETASFMKKGRQIREACDRVISLDESFFKFRDSKQ